MKQFLVLILLLLLDLTSAGQELKPNVLEGYVEKDFIIKYLDKETLPEFYKQLEKLTGDTPPKIEVGSLLPWWVKPFAAGQAAWMFVEANPNHSNPGVCAVQVHVFDKNWKRFVKQLFPTGYRFTMNEVTVAKDNPLKRDLLMVKITSTGPFMIRGGEKRPAFEQGDFQRQYYALLGERIVMVRLEDNEGKLVQNHYRWSVPPKGPPVHKRPTQEWIASLNSPNPTEQLETLVWLSGTHLPSTTPRREDVNQESVEDSRSFEAVRDAAETKKALGELQSSKNPWVQEYAKFALHLLDQ